MEDVRKLDFYKLLDVEMSASEDVIRKAYKKKALKCHPDKNPDDSQANEEFKKLSKAFQVLSDPLERCKHDQELRERRANEQRKQGLKRQRSPLLQEDFEARKRTRNEDIDISGEELLRTGEEIYKQLLRAAGPMNVPNNLSTPDRNVHLILGVLNKISTF